MYSYKNFNVYFEHISKYPDNIIYDILYYPSEIDVWNFVKSCYELEKIFFW